MKRINAVPHHSTVFRQLTQHLPSAHIERLIAEHRADKGVRKLRTRQLLQLMLFCHLSEARGLRDVIAILESQDARRYHSGLCETARSTLSDALALRPAAVFCGALAAVMPRLSGKFRRPVGECLQVIDSTTIPLNSLSADWARFSARSCAAKAHIIFDPDANCPLYLAITPARINDITAAKAMPITPGVTYCFDLGYYSYDWWAKLDEAACRVVTRLKANTPLQVVKIKPLSKAAREAGIVYDQIGFLPRRLTRSRRNPMANAVREIGVEIKPGTVLRVVSNDLDATAEEVAGIYKRRWSIELFFRWIKQMLKFRHFYGTSDNAVRIQIAVALIAFVLIRLAHEEQTGVESLTGYGRLITANLLHRTPLVGMGGEGRAPPKACPQNKLQGVLL
jgi:hypothetical protein